MITREDIQHERDMSAKKYPKFHADVLEFHAKRGTPKSIRRHEVKSKARGRALSKKKA